MVITKEKNTNIFIFTPNRYIELDHSHHYHHCAVLLLLLQNNKENKNIAFDLALKKVSSCYHLVKADFVP